MDLGKLAERERPLGGDLDDLDVGLCKRLTPEHEPLAMGVPGPAQD
jgi:hypothetical protein